MTNQISAECVEPTTVCLEQDRNGSDCRAAHEAVWEVALIVCGTVIVRRSEAEQLLLFGNLLHSSVNSAVDVMPICSLNRENSEMNESGLTALLRNLWVNGPSVLSSQVVRSETDEVLMAVVLADRVDTFDPVMEGRDQVARLWIL